MEAGTLLTWRNHLWGEDLGACAQTGFQIVSFQTEPRGGGGERGSLWGRESPCLACRRQWGWQGTGLGDRHCLCHPDELGKMQICTSFPEAANKIMNIFISRREYKHL